jgi:hypothetical protein
VQSQKRTSLTNVQAAVPEGVVSLPGHLARCHRGLDRHASKILRVEMGSPFVVPKGHRHRHGSTGCSKDRHLTVGQTESSTADDPRQDGASVKQADNPRYRRPEGYPQPASLIHNRVLNEAREMGKKNAERPIWDEGRASRS